MLDTIKRWFMKIQTLSVRNERIYPFGALNEALESLLDHGITHAQIIEHIREMDITRERVTDPRELPRPRRRLIQNKLSELSYKRSNKTNNLSRKEWCFCHNCIELKVQLSECAICLERIWPKNNVASCFECGNIACGKCAAKLNTCPYCRSRTGLDSNLALKRLINNLEMPCKKVSIHDIPKPPEFEVFELDFILLPLINEQVLCIDKQCEWTGNKNQLPLHMMVSHACFINEGPSICVVINEYEGEDKRNGYYYGLSYLSIIYICNIVLMETKLKIAFASVTKMRNTDIGLCITITSDRKTIKGVIPLSKKKTEVLVCLESLPLLCKKKPDITITLTIKHFKKKIV